LLFLIILPKGGVGASAPGAARMRLGPKIVDWLPTGSRLQDVAATKKL